MSTTDEARVTEAVEQLLAEHDPKQVDKVTFRGAVYDAGLAWIHFPEGWGGMGLAPTHQRIVEKALREAGGPSMDQTQFFGLALAGPTVVSHGSEDLKSRTLRRMYTGEDAWCQLFSEPGAGSDLAGLSCKAVRDGDEWVVSGQKVWNTMAHLANKGMLVARTDPDQPKHKGLTYFMVDMTAPGVDVRPLRQITGEAEFNEVYLDEVRIPDADRIGDIGDGWRVSMTTLMNERTSIGGGGGGGPRPAGSGPIAEAVRIWNDLPDWARTDAHRDRLMQLWVQAEALRLTNIRAGQARKAGNPGPESSISKLMLALVNKDIYAYCVDLLGAQGLVDYDFEMRRADAIGLEGPPGSARKMFLRSRANSIEGGTSEIMKNILGERVLGLPGEPRVDKDLPWKEVPR
ncbi:acyl-CoA dehydrogenase family protein [Acidimicrobiia bacterium EGI L10123]|uniref:acyl-CoA dehydrogenase family protein n=1 Tax=Salinilacustrithrix flava TaxID=2957203 RepID=UPI003D7C1E0E|nr:acyl-CoA dehydrogenase family protein [Acidimicrobiia bacterium EGI L10123]